MLLGYATLKFVYDIDSCYSKGCLKNVSRFSFSSVKKKLIADCNAAWIKDGDDSQSVASSTGTTMTTSQNVSQSVTGGESDVGKGAVVRSTLASMKHAKSSEWVLLPHQHSVDSSLRINMR